MKLMSCEIQNISQKENLFFLNPFGTDLIWKQIKNKFQVKKALNEM